MFGKQQLKIKRLRVLMSVLSKYGFKEVLARMNLKNDEKVSGDEMFNKSVYVRIRLALEELGPTFVKFGQAFSQREDLLPKEMIAELQNLQDRVVLDDLDIHQVLKDQLGDDYREYFQEINAKPLASASIAQVYRATLKDGQQVVLKVKRPDIDEMIQGDLLIMKDIAKVLTNYFEFAENLNLEQSINIFEKSLLNELSLINERENLERFAFNFRNNNSTYVPKVFPSLSNNEVLCMEYVEGYKITDKEGHEKYGHNPKSLAKKGLNLFLVQILEHGFFHADPHAGNILVTPEGKVVFIDLGAMGTILPSDQDLLEELVINLISKNVDRLVAILKKMAIKLEIKDETKLKNDIKDILNHVDTKSLDNINLEVLFDKFKQILFENRVIMPDYFALLFKGISLIEGVGRSLDPEMNIIKSIEPYVSKIMMRKFSPKYIFEKGMLKMGEFGNDLQNIPVELRNVLQQLNEGRLKVVTQNPEEKNTQQIIKQAITSLILGILLGANIIATAIIILAKIPPLISEIPLLAFLGFIFSAILTIILFLRMTRK